MPPSARPQDAAARIAHLSTRSPSTGGWVPRQPAFAPPIGAAPSVVVQDAPALRAAEVELVEPTTPATVGRSLRSARLDPGRHGVIALLVVGALAAAIAGGVMLRGRPSQQPLAVPAVVGSTDATGGAEVVVDVAGKVRRPGLVRLRAGSRVDDALKAAGGVLPGATTAGLNLARKLADGEQVLVGVEPVAGTVGGGPASGGLLDLNSATVQDFDGLPGIGPVLADHIVAWRTEHGRFASIDQLREVSGIGEAKYASIKAKVHV